VEEVECYRFHLLADDLVAAGLNRWKGIKKREFSKIIVMKKKSIASIFKKM